MPKADKTADKAPETTPADRVRTAFRAAHETLKAGDWTKLHGALQDLLDAAGGNVDVEREITVVAGLSVLIERHPGAPVGRYAVAEYALIRAEALAYAALGA